MDTLSHALWGIGLFGKKGKILLALFFGMLPDLISFGIWIPFRLYNHGFQFGKPPIDIIPDWVIINYNIGHSLVIALLAAGLAALWRKDIAFVMLAWPFHLLLDIPFHTAEYFPTALFWPFSNYAFNGVPWSNPWIWYTNIAGLIILFIYRIKKRKKNEETSNIEHPTSNDLHFND